MTQTEHLVRKLPNDIGGDAAKRTIAVESLTQISTSSGMIVPTPVLGDDEDPFHILDGLVLGDANQSGGRPSTGLG